MSPTANILSDGTRLHLQHGPIDLIIGADGQREVAFEAAAFDLIDKTKWSQSDNLQDRIITPINLLANALNINKNRLLFWIFLRIIISAQWFIEDNGNPDEMLNLASTIYPLIVKQYH